MTRLSGEVRLGSRPHLLVITGSMGAGKTTVLGEASDLLVATPHSAVTESLRERTRRRPRWSATGRDPHGVGGAQLRLEST